MNRIETDWRDYLAEQNEELKQFGDNSISVEQDENGYYSVSHTIDGKTEEISSGCFEDEVNGCIDLALGYIVGYRAGSEAAVSDPVLLAHPSMRNCFNRKEVENMVMLSADLYKRLYDSERVDCGALEVAALVIEHGCKMERWLTEKYGKDDEEYLDRLEEYEAMVEREYDLDRLGATAQPVETDFYSIEDDSKGVYPFTLVDKANVQLIPMGKELQIVRHEPEGSLYGVDILDVDGDGNITNIHEYAMNFREDELEQCVEDALHYAISHPDAGKLDEAEKPDPQTPANALRAAWDALPDDEMAAILAEFYNDLTSEQKDDFLCMTGNE